MHQRSTAKSVKQFPRNKKGSAETGSLYRTACILGALSKDILPKTDRLLRCYGTPASEIASNSSINPQGTQFRDGLFSKHISIDTTSIWAVATSGGSSPLAVYLLACIVRYTAAVGLAVQLMTAVSLPSLRISS
jgi:hypothetical protein